MYPIFDYWLYDFHKAEIDLTGIYLKWSKSQLSVIWRIDLRKSIQCMKLSSIDELTILIDNDCLQITIIILLFYNVHCRIQWFKREHNMVDYKKK